MEGLLSATLITPRRICIALAISSTTIGSIAPGAFPLLHALISDIPLPTLYASPPKSYAYQPLLSYLSAVKINPDLSEYPYRNTAEFVREVISTICSISQLQDAIENYIAPVAIGGGLLDGMKIIDPDGPLGMFVREVHVTYQSISFEAVTRLYKDFVSYVDLNHHKASSEREDDPSLDVSRCGHEELIDRLDRAVGNVGFSLAHGCPVDNDKDFTLILNVNRVSTEKTAAVNIAVKEMMASGIPKRKSMSIAGTEFVKYCEASRRRNFAQSIDSLHRYGDLSLAEISAASGRETAVHHDPDTVGRDPYAAARAAILLGRPHNVKFPPHEMGHQYTCLSLAKILFNFGYRKQAVAALNDAMRVAQQAGDDDCQALALKLMARTTASPRKRMDLFALADDQLSVARTRLQSSAIDYSGRRHPGESSSLEPSPFSLNDHCHSRILDSRIHAVPSPGDISVDSLLVSAAAWVSCGSLPTALSLAKVALKLSQYTRPSKFPSPTFVAEKDGTFWDCEVRSLAAVYELKAQLGHREACIHRLKQDIDKLRERRTHPSSRHLQRTCTSRPEVLILQRCFYWLSFQEALCVGHVQIAKHFCQKLEECASMMSATDVDGYADAELDALEAKCCWLLCCESYSEAIVYADLLIQKSAIYRRTERFVGGYRLKAEVHLKSGSATTGLAPALAAVSLSQGLGLQAAYIRATLTLIALVLSLPDADSVDAISVSGEAIRQVMPLALEGLGLREKGDVLMLQGKSLRASCRCLEGLQNSVQEIVGYFENAVTCYKALQFRAGLKECYCCMARIYNDLGELRERDEWANKYRDQVKKIHDARKITYS